MYYCIGLMNPGKEYEQTPHNIGGYLLKNFYKDHEHFFKGLREESKRKREITEGMISDSEIALVFPTTYMNTSGTSVSDVEDSERLIVLYDDIDLPFGEVRVSFDRGDGGHNGVKDIIKVLGTRSFVRIRIGVAPTDWFGNPRKPKGRDAVTNYLTKKKISKKYAMCLPDVAVKVEEAILTILREGRVKAMNKIN